LKQRIPTALERSTRTRRKNGGFGKRSKKKKKNDEALKNGGKKRLGRCAGKKNPERAKFTREALHGEEKTKTKSQKGRLDGKMFERQTGENAGGNLKKTKVFVMTTQSTGKRSTGAVERKGSERFEDPPSKASAPSPETTSK